MTGGLASAADFAPLLWATANGAADPQESRLVARNFLLDENLTSARVDAYPPVRRAGATLEEWRRAHGDYVTTEIDLIRPVHTGAAYRIDPSQRDRCPDAFRYPEALSKYGQVDTELHLVRVWSALSLAAILRLPGNDPSMLVDVCRSVLNNPKDQALRQELNDMLAVVADSISARPQFAALHLEVEAHLDPSTNWPERIRDRLGLLHLQPGPGQVIPLLVFKYPVRATPELADRPGIHALATPTALDAGFFPAFCPAPSGSGGGMPVDLEASHQPLIHEVLHGWMKLRAEHLIALGELRECCAVDLGRARGTHLFTVQATTDREDYGNETDADLLAAV